MKAKLYERYYKLGFSHFLFKNVLGLKKPSKEVKLFYVILITIILILANLLF